MKYAGINYCDMANGPGWRVSLFVSGCGFRCEGCFNAEAQDFSFGYDFTHDVYCRIASVLKRPYISGLTLLGGDPFWQKESDRNLLSRLARDVHSIGKSVWAWTGFRFDDIANEQLTKDCDVIVDGQYVESLHDATLRWRGSSNQRIIDVPKSLSSGHAVLLEGV